MTTAPPSSPPDAPKKRPGDNFKKPGAAKAAREKQIKSIGAAKDAINKLVQDAQAQQAPPPVDPKRLELEIRVAQLSPLWFARAVFPHYKPAPHLKLLGDKLELVSLGHIKRLMVFMPPRHGKTTLVSHVFPAWYLGHHRTANIIATTYAQEYADDIGRAVRNVINDDRNKMIFGTELSSDSKAANRFSTADGGKYYAVGAMGPITGRGADLFIIDDPIKGREDADSETMRRKLKEWYGSVAYTRLHPDARVVVVQTRWHEDDLSGWLLSEHKHENWEVVSLPAILPSGQALWEERYPLAALEKIKRTLTEREWQSLYMQDPRPDKGHILQREWWKRWDVDRQVKPKFECVVQSWDTAYSEKQEADYSACTTWGMFKPSTDSPLCTMLIGAWRGRVPFNNLTKKAVELYKEWSPDHVLIEAKSSGFSLLQELRRLGLPIRPYQPGRDDKRTRAWSITPYFESGRVYAPYMRWADEVIEECAAFPVGKHDDYVDTTVQAVRLLRDMWWARTPEEDETDEDRAVAWFSKYRRRESAYG